MIGNILLISVLALYVIFGCIYLPYVSIKLSIKDKNSSTKEWIGYP